MKIDLKNSNILLETMTTKLKEQEVNMTNDKKTLQSMKEMKEEQINLLRKMKEERSTLEFNSKESSVTIER